MSLFRLTFSLFLRLGFIGGCLFHCIYDNVETVPPVLDDLLALRNRGNVANLHVRAQEIRRHALLNVVQLAQTLFEEHLADQLVPNDTVVRGGGRGRGVAVEQLVQRRALDGDVARLDSVANGNVARDDLRLSEREDEPGVLGLLEGLDVAVHHCVENELHRRGGLGGLEEDVDDRETEDVLEGLNAEDKLLGDVRLEQCLDVLLEGSAGLLHLDVGVLRLLVGEQTEVRKEQCRALGAASCGGIHETCHPSAEIGALDRGTVARNVLVGGEELDDKVRANGAVLEDGAKRRRREKGRGKHAGDRGTVLHAELLHGEDLLGALEERGVARAVVAGAVLSYDKVELTGKLLSVHFGLCRR
eukprot:PhM_4_TR1990/c0_g1_i1/m.17193